MKRLGQRGVRQVHRSGKRLDHNIQLVSALPPPTFFSRPISTLDVLGHPHCCTRLLQPSIQRSRCARLVSLRVCFREPGWWRNNPLVHQQFAHTLIWPYPVFIHTFSALCSIEAQGMQGHSFSWIRLVHHFWDL